MATWRGFSFVQRLIGAARGQLLPVIAVILAVLACPTTAQTLTLDLPLDCDLGETCFIQQYVDADPGTAATDFTGGPLSYDGHRGTDFRVADQEAMAEGVPVLAPAPGVVLGIRDGMEDAIPTDLSDVAGRECGNGVAIDHGDGWVTQLCHLALGSIVVRTGDTVSMGQELGRIGLSGATQFPHVHLGVRHNGEVIDPFVADLWQDEIAYEPGGLLSMGMAEDIPDFAAVKAGSADAQHLSMTAPALVVWASMFGGRAEDVIALSIRDPDGRVVIATDVVLERTQAELFRAVGRRLSAPAWPVGDYVATAVLLRDGEPLDRLEAIVPVR